MSGWYDPIDYGELPDDLVDLAGETLRTLRDCFGVTELDDYPNAINYVASMMRHAREGRTPGVVVQLRILPSLEEPKP